MFDIGFSELLLIGVVALVVLGPERLPRVARTAGHLMGRLQRYLYQVKSDIRREMDQDDLRRLHEALQQGKTAWQRELQAGGEHYAQALRTALAPPDDPDRVADAPLMTAMASSSLPATPLLSPQAAAAASLPTHMPTVVTEPDALLPSRLNGVPGSDDATLQSPAPVSAPRSSDTTRSPAP